MFQSFEHNQPNSIARTIIAKELGLISKQISRDDFCSTVCETTLAG